MVLLSPFATPTDWSYAAIDSVIPVGLVHAGDTLAAVRATCATPTSVRAPGWCGLRRAPAGAGVALQLQLLPFRMRAFATRLTAGLPTLYYLFDAPTDLIDPDDPQQDEAAETDVLANVSAVTIAAVLPDRGGRDAALVFRLLAEACDGLGGDFAGFADAVGATLAGPQDAPLRLFDHGLRPLKAGRVRLAAGATTHEIDLVEADGGDLQRAVARLHAADPAAMPLASVWAGGPVTLTPLDASGAASDFQLTCLETGETASASLAATPQARHLALTDLFRWFAPQRASTQLKRYSRGNEIALLVNGREYFADLFARLDEVAASGGGFHLSGWDMHPKTVFRERPDGAPDDFATTLEEAVKNIGAGGGMSRFLPADFYEIDNPQAVAWTEYLILMLVLDLLLLAYILKIDPLRTNGSGAIVVMLLMLANPVLIGVLTADGALAIEPNKPAKDALDDPAKQSVCNLAPYPAKVDDNPLAAHAGFLFDKLFKVTRRFGIFHQKLAVTEAGGAYTGYVGGVDLNPNRIDDTRHNALNPFHDAHARVRGPAVRDLALTFEDRWQRDGGGTTVALPTPPEAGDGDGRALVQVARTYFKPADPSRALSFAPQGDRTLADTLIGAIRNASQFIYIEDQYFTPPAEYRDALIAKVANAEIRKLVVTIPSITDQPFGEAPRSGFIQALRTADAGRGIVQVGTPRRRYTVPVRELRSSEGMMILLEPMDATPTDQGGPFPPDVTGTDLITVGPKGRVPLPPFWASIDGELVYAFDEAGSAVPGVTKLWVQRGPQTRIVSGQGVPQGSTPRAHKAGAAVTRVDLTAIYVHAKMMIVDDAFLSIGSANLNRRGLYHDGEIDIFVVPDRLRAAPDNPIRAFRRRLWSEMADIPEGAGLPLFDDPIAAAPLLQRSYFLGNRMVEPEAVVPHAMFGVTFSDGLVATAVKLLVGTLAGFSEKELFDSVTDPTSALDPSPGA